MDAHSHRPERPGYRQAGCLQSIHPHVERMKDMDMEITGMNHEFFLAGEELRQGTMKCMLVTCPKAACICRNVDANSDTIQLFGGTGREGGKF